MAQLTDLWKWWMWLLNLPVSADDLDNPDVSHVEAEQQLVLYSFPSLLLSLVVLLRSDVPISLLLHQVSQEVR